VSVVRKRPVVVGFDGSPGWWAVVHYAAEMCSERGLTLRMVHGFPNPPPTPSLPNPVAAAWRFLADARARVLDGYPRLEVDAYAAVRAPAALLIDESRSAAMVVVGRIGHRRYDGGHTGSVGRRVAVSASCPVLVVHDASRRGAVVVVGIDAQSPSSAAVEFASEEAALRGVEVHALFAWSGPAAVGHRLLADALTQWPAKYPQVPLHSTIAHGAAAEALLEASAHAGLIVIGPHAVGQLRSLLPGSVAHALLHQAQCPIAVVHAGDRSDLMSKPLARHPASLDAPVAR
jgi:nucleotide-binding universal stress UspA family protein